MRSCSRSTRTAPAPPPAARTSPPPGSLYLAEPGYPTNKKYGQSLYASDWTRGILYRHDLTPQGAGFKATQEDFLSVRPTDLDADACGHLFVADWGRGDWGNAPAVGGVDVVEAPDTTATTSPSTRPAP